MKGQLTLTLALLSVWGGQVTAANDDRYQPRDLQQFLKAFREDTAKTMRQLPPKEGASVPLFSAREVQEMSFVGIKDRVRRKICRDAGADENCVFPDKAAMDGPGDSAAAMIDNPSGLISDLDHIESSIGLARKISQKPWSDDYWPTFKGMLGQRYGDPKRPDTKDWGVANKFYQSLPPLKEYNDGRGDLLSPSEKYDLLVGDLNFTLTKKMWAEGAGFYERYRRVPLWMGICHGWAPASFMLPRPANKIRVLAGDGRNPITFYPADIKALASLLWAKTNVRARFAGTRCDVSRPAQDSNGRIIDKACFDTNPGTWHLAVTNQIGIGGRPFILDTTYDHEVWNQPVLGYSYTYFNPRTGQTGRHWRDVAIELDDYHNDKFRSYRGKKTEYVVGVEMKLEYVVETVPRHRELDTPELDASNHVVYRYDLELDGSGRVLGGEWYVNAHPDFLWVPAHSARAITASDRYLGGDVEWEWNSRRNAFLGVPGPWRTSAINEASTKGAPLAHIVEGLIRRSNGTQ